MRSRSCVQAGDLDLRPWTFIEPYCTIERVASIHEQQIFVLFQVLSRLASQRLSLLAPMFGVYLSVKKPSYTSLARRTQDWISDAKQHASRLVPSETEEDVVARLYCLSIFNEYIV